MLPVSGEKFSKFSVWSVNDLPHAYFRSVFGGSVGPNKRTLANGKVEQFFEGVKVRSQPLPLRLPVSAQSQASAAQPQKTVVVAANPVAVAKPALPSQPVPIIKQTPVVVATSTAATPASATVQAPSSPILTNLLHRKSPGPEKTNNDQVRASSLFFSLLHFSPVCCTAQDPFYAR